MENNMDSKNFLLIIKEYESVIESLTSQVEFYAKEQEQLRKEIVVLVAENSQLSQTVNEALDSRSSLYKEKHFKSDLVDNLKNQLGLSLKEKDTVVELWQNALKNIDHLEEDLKLFEGRTHGYFPKSEVIKLKQKYETQIKDLGKELATSRLKFENVLHKSTKQLENKSAEVEKVTEKQKKSFILVGQLENEIRQLHNKLKESMAINDKLQITLEAKNCLIEELKIKDVHTKAKVTEALQIVETAFSEKDAALLRENEAKEEVAKLSQTLSEIIDETTEKVKREILSVKQEHKVKLAVAHQNTEKLKAELHVKNIELEKYATECKSLKEKLERSKNGSIINEESNMSKLLILEKNLEATFQKLLLSERKNLQVMAQKDSIKADLDQMASYYENDVKTRETEKQVLKNEVRCLKKQHKISRSKLILVAGEVDKLNTKIKLMDIEVREKLQEKDLRYKEALTTAIKSVESENMKVQNELHAQLELHVDLSTKYKKEMQEIIDKFEKRMQELQDVNKSLRSKLQQAVSETLLQKKKVTEIGKYFSKVLHNQHTKNSKSACT